MLYMVIERFKNGDFKAAGERFRERGRMMPDGVTYQCSWLDGEGRVCYQVMEATSRGLLDEWIANWSDLVDFEVVPVLTSAEFWSRQTQR